MYDIEVAIKTIGNICKTEGIPLAELAERFPDRPTTEAECAAIATWLGERISRKNSGYKPAGTATDSKPDWSKPRAATTPSQPSSPQAPALPTNTDKNGKPRATRYALRGEDGEVKFYRVKAGRKLGFYFVDVQASDDYYPIKNYTTKQAILKAIAADPEAALALYGQEVGACGRCGRTLTSEYRKLGIGPVCIDK